VVRRVPYRREEIWPRVRTADVFCAIGTSGVVYPAAGFGELAATYGARTVELNMSRSEVAPWFDDVARGAGDRARAVVGRRGAQ
jgi:NAD-dependent deacetylase